MTVAVDRALKTNDLSIYLSIFLVTLSNMFPSELKQQHYLKALNYNITYSEAPSLRVCGGVCWWSSYILRVPDCVVLLL